MSYQLFFPTLCALRLCRLMLFMHSIQQSYRNLFLFVKSKASVLLRNRFINLLRGVPLPDVTGEIAQRSIALAIKGGRKLVARVGETEGRAVVFYLRNRKNEASVISYPAEVRERLKLFFWLVFSPVQIRKLMNSAGYISIQFEKLMYMQLGLRTTDCFCHVVQFFADFMI